MKAAGFVPTSIQQKAQEEEHAKHRKRIEKILTTNKKNNNSSSNLKMSQQLQKNMKAMHNEKFQSIDKDNKFLLEKLIEISRKKPGVTEKTEVSQSKSLHGTYRKKEMLRISMENEAFAKRLLAQQSTFDKKKINNDFKKHQALLSQIKRVSTSPNKAAQKKLPPLTLEIKIPKAEGASTTNKSTTAKDINKSIKDQVASAPLREEKKSPNKLPDSAKEVETKKTDETKKVDEVIAPEVPSQKTVDEKKTERVEEAPKEDIKEKEHVAEEVIPVATVEEKVEKSEPEVQAQAEEEKNVVVEKPVESTGKIEEEIPKDETKPEEAEHKEEQKLAESH